MIKNPGKIIHIFLNDYFILGLILTNSLLVFIQEFEISFTWLNSLEFVFTVLFMIEMIVKIQFYGFKNYILNSWNRLDFILIIVSIPSLASIFIENSAYSLNIFLAFRVLRVFKFFRLMRFFPDIASMIAGVKRAIQASYIVLFAFITLLFVFSLLSCTMFKNIAPEYFGNPMISIYSTFRLFSIEGWYEIPDLIAERTTPVIAFLTKTYFIIILFFGGILGLSLVNSIFVDAMVSDNNDDLKKELTQIKTKIDNLTNKIDQLSNK